MKIGRNDPCPCGSGKKYKKCCLDRDTLFHPRISAEFLRGLQSVFDYIQPIATNVEDVIKKYDFNDAVTAVFCFNSWRRNRSALAQGLCLNMAIFNCTSFGSQSIKSYHELETFYDEISRFTSITSREDYTIDDFGEVFISHSGKTHSIITGTGHQQVYGAMRYMQTLATICNRDNELCTILEYVSTIIRFTKETNIPNSDQVIAFELPSEEFWNAVKRLFDSSLFQEQVTVVSQIMGYQFGPIEMRHFIKKESNIFPLFNASILVDYYKLLLKESTPTERDNHITQTILSLVENSFNFSPKTPNRILIKPVIIDCESNEQIVSNGLLFAGFGSDCLLIAIDKKSFSDDHQICAAIQQIAHLNRTKGLRLAERYYREELHGGYGIDIDQGYEIIYMIINPFTDITTNGSFLGTPMQEFECTALDAIYLLGFSNGVSEVVEYIKNDRADQTQIFSFGGKSNHFFTWKNASQNVSSGAIEFDHLFVYYNETEEYTYSYFRDILCEFPQNALGLFKDPLNWTTESSSLGYSRIYHKGCHGFGGEIKALDYNTYVFLAHNVEFFTEEDFAQDAHTALKTIDELNQRLCVRYAGLISNIEVLKGKTLQLLFMPWKYASKNLSYSFLRDTSRKIVFSDEHLEPDSMIIRYSVKPEVILSTIMNATNRLAENTYFMELLSPLSKYSPAEYQLLETKLIKDSTLKKTVGVFTIEQHYYFSDRSLDTDISTIGFARARKEIAKVCLDSGVEPGEYRGKAATAVIRKMQTSVVGVFEKYISDYDKYELHKRVLNYYAIQLNGAILNINRYTAFTDLDETVQSEFEQGTITTREEYRRYIRTAEYLLESNLVVAHSEAKNECTKKDFEFLLAFADWLAVLQDDADTCFYTDFDLSISVDTEYKVDTLLSQTAREKYDALLSRKYNTEDYQIKDDTTDLEFFKRAIDAFNHDTGIDIGLLISLLEYMQLGIIQDNAAVEIYPNVFEIGKQILEQKFNENLEDKVTDLRRIAGLIDFLTLDPTALKTVNGTQHDILPVWERENRDNRFNAKPIIVQEEKCIFSPVSMNNVLTSWKNGITEWYLPYEIGLPSLKAILNEWKKRYEDEMVQDIAQLFRNANFDISIPEVELVHRFPQDNYPEELGDYDVIAINKTNHEVWIIESKVLQKVGSIYEDQMQQKSFFFQHKDDEKFQRRIDYMVQNTSKVLTSFGIDRDEYTVVPYMVTNKLFASRYKELAFPIITYSELEQILDGKPKNQ